MLNALINITLLSLVLCTGLRAQSSTPNIEWIDLREALLRQQFEQKKILIKVYTDWSNVCKKMDQISLSQPSVVEYINENYYPVLFNAETEADVNFLGKVYQYVEKSNRGYHEFAYKITHGRLIYPSLVFLDKDLSIIQSIYGFHDPDKLLKILTYFAEDYNKKIPWKDFDNQYQNMIYQSNNLNSQ